jgi:nicotinate phosphoribosyltransferase
MPGFHIASEREILSGKVTDVYFERTLKVLKARGIDPVVKMEVIAKGLPGGSEWGVFAGLEEALHLLKKLPVKVRALREGSVFFPCEPVLELEGRYQKVCVYETALLGLLCQASGVATKAARFKRLAGERPVISFGARRMHPAVAPMIERNAYLGGCDGVAVVKSGEVIGEDPMGTMPHALIICFGSTVEALKAYDEVLEPGFKRVALVDTFLDEKFECMNVAGALGKRLHAVRLDTPSSRRGDFVKIIKECRWELEARGYGHVRFFVSGGIREEDMPALNEVVDGYGVGTSISGAPPVDYSLDIVELEGEAVSKRGKLSGSKSLLACTRCGKRMVALRSGKKAVPCACGGRMKDLLEKVLGNGKMLLKPEPMKRIRMRALKEAAVAGSPKDFQ